jgi:putative glutamine amidotransferase
VARDGDRLGATAVRAGGIAEGAGGCTVSEANVVRTAEKVSKYRSLVAVVAYHLADDRVPRWPHGGYGVPAPYLDRLRTAGARTAIISPGERGGAEEILEPFDGLLLVGGGDVDPRRYGQELSENVYGVEPDRDAFEIDVLHAADELGIPTLCICRGMQVMNVAFGGTLVQHLPDVPGVLEHGAPVEDERSMHEVRSDQRSRLRATTGVETLSCSSHHHQAPDRIGEGLRATGWTADGVVEAIERERDDNGERPYEAGWMLGVQWHPEDTAANDPAQQALFDSLSNLARWRGTRAKPGVRVGRNREYGLVDYDPAWPGLFEDESARIRASLGDVAVRIDHVGSTAVPGLAAKPTIDIQVSVESMTPRDRFVAPLVGLGYEFVPDPMDTEHEYFKKEVTGARTYQIHVCPVGSEWEQRHLAFRDHLGVNPGDAARYAELKRRLAAQHPRDVISYVEGKTPFIREIEKRALAPEPSTHL